jgi:hypothetical protein
MNWILSCSSCASCQIVLSDFSSLTADCGTKPEHQKTYRRFLGAIYFGGAKSAVPIERKHLTTPKSAKNRKNAKKSVKYFRLDPCFSANGKLI